MAVDTNHQYRQDELPSDIFNSSNGDVKTFDGQQVHVIVNNNGTRTLQPVSAQEQALTLAKQAQDLQVQANQPAIATLSGQQTDLKQRYKDLLDSITASEQPALNDVIKATNTGLGARGLTGNSEATQEAIASAELPIATQFGQLKANTGVSEQNDLNTLAGQIASLQAGNVGNALNFSSNIGNQQTSLQAAQITAAGNVAAAQAQPKYISYPTTGLFNTGTGSNVLPTFPSSKLNNTPGLK